MVKFFLFLSFLTWELFAKDEIPPGASVRYENSHSLEGAIGAVNLPSSTFDKLDDPAYFTVKNLSPPFFTKEQNFELLSDISFAD